MKDWLSSLSIAFTMLTRLPLPSQDRIIFSDKNCSRSTVFFPLVGLFYGLIWAAALILLNLFINDNNLKAFVIIAIPYFMNKFFHLDGLADTLDAFLADRTKEERLVILKDSRIGSFALGGIIFYLLLKFLLTGKLIAFSDPVPVLIAIPVLSRYGIVFLSLISKYPREKGTGKSIVGKIQPPVFILATLLTLSIITGIILFYGTGLIFTLFSGLILVVLSALIMKLISQIKIGGVTGDVLGASVELMELLLILLFLFLNRFGGRI